jgi:hypothetical protein
MGQPKFSFQEGLMPLKVSFKVQSMMRRAREMVSGFWSHCLQTLLVEHEIDTTDRDDERWNIQS